MDGKKAGLIRDQFRNLVPNVPVASGQAKNIREVITETHRTLKLHGYPLCAVYVEMDDQGSAVVPQSVLDEVEAEMAK